MKPGAQSEAAMTSAGQTEQLSRFFALGDIDIFQSGLVLQDDAGLRITDAGLSLLHSLESPSSPPFDPYSDSPPVRLTDKDAGLTERIRLFDLALTAPATDSDEGIYDYQSALGEESRAVAYATPKVGAANLHASTDSAFRRERRQKSLKLDRLRAYIAAKKQFILGIWRHHLVRTSSATLNLKNKRLTQNIGGAAFAFLSLVLVIACVVIAIAFGQIQSLKSDIAALRRELLPAKERITRLELIEKAKRDLEQDEEAQKKSDTDKSKLRGKHRSNRVEPFTRRDSIDKRIHQAGTCCGLSFSCDQCRRPCQRCHDSSTVATHREGTKIAWRQIYDPRWRDHHREKG